MTEMLDWDDYQRQFYWRTIGNVLHTNAQKHRIYPEWSSACRLCRDHREDTQLHRYGAGGSPCASVTEFYADLSLALEDVCIRFWLPDQESYTAGWSHEVTIQSGLPTRSWWANYSFDRCLWRPLVKVAEDAWLHAINILWLVISWTYVRNASHLFQHEAQRESYWPAHQQPFYQFHPSQISDRWDAGTLHEGYPRAADALRCRAPTAECVMWWVDDVFIPESERWWAAFTDWYESLDTGKHLWIACYEGTPGFRGSLACGVSWVVYIPVKAVILRTNRSVRQACQIPRRDMTSKNPRAIWIGVCGSETTHGELRSYEIEWASGLQHGYSPAWVLSDRTQDIPRGFGSRQSIMSWISATATTGNDITLTSQRRWLEGSFPELYKGPDWMAALAISNK
ncbi:hypothetical protein PHMEG_00031979 [Phytophthora megakarya]|uniref:Uncharacterized protein n=1 Tax=Phytophthora megakarya TaxID=4795 RepID=A0A225UY74_9STRA|nr:hypothetical protein PHMEG_00031979 [Phytophthora megakarya]